MTTTADPYILARGAMVAASALRVGYPDGAAAYDADAHQNAAEAYASASRTVQPSGEPPWSPASSARLMREREARR